MSHSPPLEDVPGQPGMKAMPGETPKDMVRCFLDADRGCGPDCMAYLTNPPTDPDYRDQHWARCHLLVNVHRGGKHMVHLAMIGSQMLKKHEPGPPNPNDIPPPKVG